MKKISIIGVGKIGALVALLLLRSKCYQVQLIDQNLSGSDARRLFELYPDLGPDAQTVDVTHRPSLEACLEAFKPEAVVSCLPFFLTKTVAEAAKKVQCHYFDLTEDTATTAYIKELATDIESTFVPQCGLAPGIIGIIANDLIQQFAGVESVALRVGALPQYSDNPLKYALTWSTDGLINEYDRPCNAVQMGKEIELAPLENLESLTVLGEHYEAFNTSGGLGSLVNLYKGKIQTMDYKSIRYPGHCEKIKFLMHDLKLRDNKPLLKQILENALPRSYQDVVILLVHVVGKRDGQLQSNYYVKKILPEIIDGFHWSAIQISTAAAVCAVIDVVLSSKVKLRGFVYQEQLAFETILKTPFGAYYRTC